jgi:hypothetical protein
MWLILGRSTTNDTGIDIKSGLSVGEKRFVLSFLGGPVSRRPADRKLEPVLEIGIVVQSLGPLDQLSYFLLKLVVVEVDEFGICEWVEIEGHVQIGVLLFL